ENSGWLWRTGESYVTGSVHTAQRNRTTTQYDVQGAPISTTAYLSGTEPLDRYTNQGTGVAPTPGTASTASSFVASTMTYDQFGNVTLELGPANTIDTLGSNTPSSNRRCRTISYENGLSSTRYA